MRVRALITLSVGNSKYVRGQEFEAEPEFAKRLIRADYVELVRNNPEPEKAVLRSRPELAVTRRGR